MNAIKGLTLTEPTVTFHQFTIGNYKRICDSDWELLNFCPSFLQNFIQGCFFWWPFACKMINGGRDGLFLTLSFAALCCESEIDPHGIVLYRFCFWITFGQILKYFKNILGSGLGGKKRRNKSGTLMSLLRVSSAGKLGWFWGQVHFVIHPPSHPPALIPAAKVGHSHLSQGCDKWSHFHLLRLW